MARYNGRLHCIVGVLPTCYKRKTATYFCPRVARGPVRLEHSEFKRLKNGDITELKLIVKEENDNVVDNQGLPMSCVLEII